MLLGFFFLLLALRAPVSEGITVSTCAELNIAIERTNNGEKVGEIQIPKGVSIKVAQCSGLTKISKTISITGVGSPAPSISGEGLFPLIYLSSKVTRLTLRNIELVSGTGISGGCVYIPGSNFGSFTRVIFRNCTATGPGGAIYSASPISLNSVQFYNNSASDGGAIKTDSTISLTSGLFSFNKAKYNGGAINSARRALLSSVQFISNTALKYGGAIYLGSPSSISKSSFVRNQILPNNDPASIQAGGAVYSFDNLNVISSNFTGNSVSSFSTTKGGALYLSRTVVISNSIFQNNTISSLNSSNYIFSDLDHSALGGAIFSKSEVKLTSSILNHNKAVSYLTTAGGGAIASEDNLFVSSSSFFGNSAVGYGAVDSDEYYNGGGAIYNRYKSSIASSTFVNNFHQSLNATYSSGGAIFFSESEYSETPSHRVSNCEFISNFVLSLGEARGGAISGYSFPGVILVSNSNFSKNTVQGSFSEGGALLIEDSGLSVFRSTFTENVATALAGDASGGAIGLLGSITSNPIRFSTFTNNRAISVSDGFANGGAIYQFYSDDSGTPNLPNPRLPLAHSVFRGNLALGKTGARGGSLYLDINQTLSTFYSSFSNSNVSAEIAEGGAIYGASFARLSFCKGNSFSANNYAVKTGKAPVLNSISSEGTQTSFFFCPTNTLPNEPSNNFTPKLGCGGCAAF